jgi:hypothetical protein
MSENTARTGRPAFSVAPQAIFFGIGLALGIGVTYLAVAPPEPTQDNPLGLTDWQRQEFRTIWDNALHPPTSTTPWQSAPAGN